MFQQRAWILQRANIELLRECQRSINELFSEKLSLTQTDLIERIIYFSQRSDNPQFLEVVSRLRDSLEKAEFDFSNEPSSDSNNFEHSSKSKPRTKMYRGQLVQSSQEKNSYDKPAKYLKGTLDPLQGETVAENQSPKRIYRGRAVS